MKILHVAGHYGGGIGTVVRGWLENDGANEHTVFSLEQMKDKRIKLLEVPIYEITEPQIADADVVVVHLWDNPTLLEYLQKLPPCRLVFWSHKNWDVPKELVAFPDLFLDVSPIQGHGRHIWSTGGVERFLNVKSAPHRGFNIGYIGLVDYRKLHKDFIPMCHEIKKRIPEAKFIIAGEVKIPIEGLGPEFQFLGHTDDVAGVLAQCDVFGYPLRPDHWGTAEQVLGEAMAAGVAPVVMDNPAERLIVNMDGFCAYDAADYAESVEWLYNFPEDRKKCAMECKARAADLYSIDKMIKSWDDVFQEMMQKPKRSHNVL
jgi:glycosyltransferase involved in cell wall biosynthesis